MSMELYANVQKSKMASKVSVSSYKYTFVSEPSEALKCLICLQVAEEPWQHGECGKLFCKSCLDKRSGKPCPNCKCKKPQYLADGKSKNEINSLGVKCENLSRKCEWVGTVGTLPDHLTSCKFALVLCPKGCKDDRKCPRYVIRKDLYEHQQKLCPNRDSTCEYCGIDGIHSQIAVHRLACQVKVIPCHTAGCMESIQRNLMKQHISTSCQHAVVPCKYKMLGCDKECKRKDLTAHEREDGEHFHMAVDKIVLLLDRVTKLGAALLKVNTQVDNLQAENITLRRGETAIRLTVTGYQKRKEKNESVYSPCHYLTPNGYLASLRVDLNGCGTSRGTHISVFISLHKGKYDAQLKWPFTGKIVFMLKNHLENNNHKMMTVDLTAKDGFTATPGNAKGVFGFIPHTELGHNPVKKTQYLKDDTLYFRLFEIPDRLWLLTS